MDEIVRFGRCLADPYAIRVLNLLRQRELTVEELNECFNVGPWSIVNRLRKLERMGLVRRRKVSHAEAFRIEPHMATLVKAIFETFEADVLANEDILRDEGILRRLIRAEASLESKSLESQGGS